MTTTAPIPPLQAPAVRGIRAVVVDVDDTLCLTEAQCFGIENEALARLGIGPMSRDVHIATWGQPLEEAITMRSPGIDVAAFTPVFRSLFHQRFLEGAVDVIPAENFAALDAIAATGRLIITLTSRTFEEAGHLLDPDHALGGRLHAAYHGGNTRFRKPDPRVFDELLAVSGLAPAQCVYVGDSPGDATAAKGAGLSFIACLESGLRTRADFAPFGPDACIDRFPQLVEALEVLERSQTSGNTAAGS